MDIELDRRRFLLGSAAAGAGLALPGLLTRTASASPSTAGPLANRLERLRKTAHAPALGVAAIYGGEVVYADGFGVLDVDTNVSTTGDSMFMLASISKTVAAVALMQAWEDGEFALDDDVNDLLPFPVRNPRFPGEKITPRMLATHTSSIHDTWGVLTPMYVDGDSPVALGDFLEDYLLEGHQYYRAANFLKDRPGSRYQYSNIGASVMAFVVEATTGIPFSTFCDQRIFQVLGMDNTSWFLAGLDQSQIAMPSRYHANTGQYQEYGFYGYPDYPDGQLRTSPRSLAKFFAAMSNGGIHDGNRILEAATVKKMLSDQLHGMEYWRQGIIWYEIRPKGQGPMWGHTGGDSGVATLAFFRMVDGAGAIILSNTNAGRWSEWGALQDARNLVVGEASRF